VDRRPERLRTVCGLAAPQPEKQVRVHIRFEAMKPTKWQPAPSRTPGHSTMTFPPEMVRESAAWSGNGHTELAELLRCGQV
jgi:hypothetical protein